MLAGFSDSLKTLAYPLPIKSFLDQLWKKKRVIGRKMDRETESEKAETMISSQA